MSNHNNYSYTELGKRLLKQVTRAHEFGEKVAFMSSVTEIENLIRTLVFYKLSPWTEHVIYIQLEITFLSRIYVEGSFYFWLLACLEGTLLHVIHFFIYKEITISLKQLSSVSKCTETFSPVFRVNHIHNIIR